MQELKYLWVSDNLILEDKVPTLPRIVGQQLPSDVVLYPSRADTSEDAANFTLCRNIKIFTAHVWLLSLIQQCVEQLFEFVIYFYLIFHGLFFDIVIHWLCGLSLSYVLKSDTQHFGNLSCQISTHMLDKAHKVKEFRYGTLPLSTYRIGSFLYCDKHLFAPFLQWRLTFNSFLSTACGTVLWSNNT